MNRIKKLVQKLIPHNGAHNLQLKMIEVNTVTDLIMTQSRNYSFTKNKSIIYYVPG